jgi:hypothetical protein
MLFLRTGELKFQTILEGNKISNAFGYYGKVVSRNPIPAIGFAVLLNCLLGINVKWITSEKDIKTLYTPTNSQALYYTVYVIELLDMVYNATVEASVRGVYNVSTK